MGSQAIQSSLWGKRPQDWASIQEATGNAGYLYVLAHLQLTSASKLLDVGCGSGLFSSLAARTGADVTGIDATQVLIDEAGKRGSSAVFLTGEMEELPFTDKTFDVVSGFNSFQYAANTENALTEAKRVLKDNGQLAVMIWGNKEDCEAATYLKAVGSLLPPPPPGAPGPFALSENQLLEKTLEKIGFRITSKEDIQSVWDYENTEIALKGLMSAGPVARAIDNSGLEKVLDTISIALRPYTQPDGRVVYNNKFRIVIAEKKKA
jgi:ubiquinone/menaquinone biosynthesis C-methylase UbiE